MDFSLGPLGGFKADAAVSFQFGLRLSAGLGGLGGVETAYEMAVDTRYDDFVVAGVEGTTAAFDFTQTRVISATSSSGGIGTASAPDVEGVGEDDQPEIPLGVSLDVVLGASLGFEQISDRLPFSSTQNVADIELFNFENQTINLFKLDAGNAQQSFDLSDEISILLRLPAGANTEGSSQGSTIVSDKGFSNNPFLAIEGDLDALRTRYLKTVPFIGQVQAVLEKTVFLNEEIDINEYIPFLPEEWFTIDVTVVDLTAAAGLHVTEEVSVDIGSKDEENLPDFNSAGAR